MKSLILLLAGTFFLGGCAATKLAERSPYSVAMHSVSAFPEFKAAVDTLLPDSLFPPCNAGIKIVSLDRGETLYELNPDMLFNPASNQKMFTAAATLSFLGPEYQLATVVLADTTTRTIILSGHGDPLLKTEDMDSLAGLAAPFLPGGPWSLLCDVSFFDDRYWGEGWGWDEEPEAYAAFVSPLILNNNAVTINVLPGTLAGDTALVEVSPPTSYVRTTNTAVTVTDSIRTRLRVSRLWRERSNVATVQGELLAGTLGREVQISVWQPERYAGTVFAERLQARHVPVTRILVDTLAPAGVEIARLSHRLDSAVTFMNKVSDNLSAESLLKTLAAERRGRPGSAESGIGVVNEMLSMIPYDSNAVSIADGSGLSRYNLTSASAIIQLLRFMHADTSRFRVFYHSLPIAGVDGTLDERMRGTRAEGNLRAKTGTLSAVSALSGYVRSRDGELLAFSILMQNYPASSRPYRAVQDRIGIFLSESTRHFYEE